MSEEQEPSAQPRERLNPQKTHKVIEILSAPPQISQIAADATIRYDRSWYLDNTLDIDEPAIACRDLACGVEKTDMSCVVKIWDRTDAPCCVAPKSNNLKITIDVFQRFRANDRIVVARIRSAIKGVADKKELWTPGAVARIADRLGAEVEATVNAVVLLDDHLRQEATPTPDFENRRAAVISNVSDNFAKEPVIARPRHGWVDLRMHAVVKIRAQLPHIRNLALVSLYANTRYGHRITLLAGHWIN